MTHRKHRGKQNRREVLAVGGEEDERQTGRDGQQEDDDGAHIGRVIEHPSDIIDCNTNNCSDNQERKAKFASALLDDEAKAGNSQHLEDGANGIHHWRDRIRAQDVVRRGNGKPDEVGEHHQQEEKQAPRVEAETVVRGVYDIHFQINI